MAETRRDWLHILEEYQEIEWPAINFNVASSYLCLPINQETEHESKINK